MVVSQSVKQCMTVDLFPHILAIVVDIQKVTLVAYTSVEQNTLVVSCENVCKTYRLLNIHCIYVSVTKPTCPALSTWLNTGSIRSMNVTGKAIILCGMALPSKSCAALHVGSRCDCNACRSLDLSVLVEILSGVDSDHGKGPRRYGSVDSRSTLCPI